MYFPSEFCTIAMLNEMKYQDMEVSSEMKIHVVWDVTSFELVNRCRRFGGS
jgi:hypothetical protein